MVHRGRACRVEGLSSRFPQTSSEAEAERKAREILDKAEWQEVYGYSIDQVEPEKFE